MTQKSQIKEPLTDELLRKYVDGCHILHYNGLVDAYGHLSVRISDDTFLMCRYMAPALVATRDDLWLYKVADGEGVKDNTPRGFSERYIHSEIYKAYPQVMAVVHSHNLDIIPFSISSKTPLRTCFHMSAFLGTHVPVWDPATTIYKNNPEQKQNMLVHNTKLGASLAKALGADKDGLPGTPLALMRGHGFVCTGESIEMVIARSIYTAQNARIQKDAIAMAGKSEDIVFFSEQEVYEAGRSTISGAVKPWPLWVAEVKNSPLYKNNI